MKVAVTGGAGFIGSHVADALLEAGHRVVILDDLSSGVRSNVPADAGFVLCDVAGPLLTRVLETESPDAVIHCAAQVSVSSSLQDPANDLSRNAGATMNVMQACGRAGVRRVVYTSSAAVYGTPRYVPIDEEHPKHPLSPYGLSKLAGEWYVRVLGDQLGVSWVILRYANVFGPRQQAHGDGAVVPAFLSEFANGRDPVIQGTGEQTRDFVYVTDVARANLLAVTGDVSGTFNVGTGAPTSILTLWHLAADSLGTQGSPLFGPPRPGDIMHSVLSNEAARMQLQWEPSVSLAEGLILTAPGMRRNSRAS